MSKEIIPSAIYTAAEAAELLTCGKTNVYDLWQSGRLAVTKIGAGNKGLRVRGSDLLAFLDDATSGGPPPKVVYKHLKRLNLA